MSRVRSESRTMLDWTSFDWKPDPRSFLRGISNYSVYRETIHLQLECIGYYSQIKLTQLDELKLAAVIQRTVTPELAEMIAGMKSGSSMIRLFENTFRRAGSIQVEALWAKLSGLKYNGGCPVNFVTKFKTHARNYQAAGGESSSSHLMILFKQAVKDKAGKWHHMVSSLARFHEWNLEHILQDFVSSHYDKIGKDDTSTSTNHVEIKGTLGNIQSENKANLKKNSSLNSKGEKTRGKKIRCWNCKQQGHVRSDCPKIKRKNETGTTFVASNNLSTDIGPPPALADEYCQIPEEKLVGRSYATQVEPDTFDNIVKLYETEMKRRRNKYTKENCNKTIFKLGTSHIQVAQQILSTAGVGRASDRWLFDTGADVDATNNRDNLTPGAIVDLRNGQFPIQT